MTYCRTANKRPVAGGATAAALVGIAALLGGCATSHVGSDWPCPLQQGSPCLSVSAADPAGPAGGRYAGPGRQQVPHAAGGAGAQRTDDPVVAVSQRPVYRAAGRGVRPESAAVERCPRGCRPLAWLRRLAGNAPEASTGTEHHVSGEPITANSVGDEPDPAAGLQPSTGLPSAGVPAAGVRIEEVVGRIWIGPYVDGYGVYHEARWVRVVIEPAGWRLP